MQNVVQLLLAVLLLNLQIGTAQAPARQVQQLDVGPPSEFEQNELVLPFPGRDDLRLKVPPSVYPEQSNESHTAMLQTYQATMLDMRAWLGWDHDPSYLPTIHDFKAYAHQRNHMQAMSFNTADGGPELWARIYMTFLHYSLGRKWGANMPGQAPGWCAPWPTCTRSGRSALPSVGSQWCEPWATCIQGRSQQLYPEVQWHITSARVPLPSPLDVAEECSATNVVVQPETVLHFPRSPDCPSTSSMLRFTNLPFTRSAVFSQRSLSQRVSG